MLVQLIQHHARHLVGLHIYDNANANSATRLVINIRDTGDHLLIHEVRDPGDHGFLVYCVGNLGDYDAFTTSLGQLNGRFATHANDTMSGFVQLDDRLHAHNRCSGRIIRPGNMLHQLRDRGLRVLHQSDGRVDYLGQVVGRDIGRHANADTRSTINQQVRVARGEDGGLLALLIESGPHVHRILVEISQQFLSEALHATLGVSIGGSCVTVDTTEVPLAIDELIAHREVLRHTDQRIIHSLVAVWMVVTNHFTDHFRALCVRTAMTQPELAHGIEDSAVAGFQSVTHIRNCAAYIDTKRVLQVRGVHDLFDVDVVKRTISHGGPR